MPPTPSANAPCFANLSITGGHRRPLGEELMVPKRRPQALTGAFYVKSAPSKKSFKKGSDAFQLNKENSQFWL